MSPISLLPLFLFASTPLSLLPYCFLAFLPFRLFTISPFKFVSSCPINVGLTPSPSPSSSLTEAFCIALLEAASCGLLCVSTRVGGVPEVLPPSMMLLAEPEAEAMVAAIGEALQRLPAVEPWAMHEWVRGRRWPQGGAQGWIANQMVTPVRFQVTEMYSWQDVARRTERVYDLVAAAAEDDVLDRLARY